MDKKPFDDNTFAEFEQTITDPIVERVYDMIEEYQELIDATPGISTTELVHIVQKIDTFWPYRGDTLKIFGWVTTNDARTGEPLRNYYDGDEFVSNGFAIESSRVNMAGSSKFQLVHDLTLPRLDGSSQQSVANISEVQLEFPYESVEAKTIRLNYFNPKVIEAVDEAVLNADNTNDAIQRLGNMRIKLSSDQERDDVKSYIDSILAVEKDVPNILTVDGVIYDVADEMRPIVQLNPQPILVYVTSCEMMNLAEYNDTEVFSVGMNFMYVPADSDSPHKSVIVALKSVKSLTSIREILFDQSRLG